MDLEQRLDLAAPIDPSPLPDRAILASLDLVDTTGPVPDWEPITEFPL